MENTGNDSQAGLNRYTNQVSADKDMEEFMKYFSLRGAFQQANQIDEQLAKELQDRITEAKKINE